jgi:N-acetylglucosamine kinase-like BadF-type ATPase
MVSAGEPRPPFVIGIDAGGTKTVCYLADGDGRLLGESRGGGANLQAVGELGLEKELHGVMARAIADRPIVPSAICLGIAGVDRPADAAVVHALMRRIGFQARVAVTNDALVALVAGNGHGPGVVVVAGTGSIAYGRDAAGRAARAGGWGYVLGDEGSGYWMGRLALRAVLREADGRGPATSLTPRILAHFDVARPDALVHEIYASPLKPSAIAALARHLQAARDEGDETARVILAQGARELVACAASVVRQLALDAQPFRFVLAGGIFRAVPWLVECLSEGLPALAREAPVVLLDREPAWGAVLLALAEAHGASQIPVYVAPRRPVDP